MGGADGRSEIFAPGLLEGQVALITGGGTGLGKATALELARCGASVTIVGRRAEGLEQAAAEIAQAAAEVARVAAEVAQAGGTAGEVGIAGEVAWAAGDVR